jgi:hypothetical protein
MRVTKVNWFFSSVHKRSFLKSFPIDIIQSSLADITYQIDGTSSASNTKNIILEKKIISRDSNSRPYWKGMLSTVDLLVLTSLDERVLIMQKLFTFLLNNVS